MVNVLCRRLRALSPAQSGREAGIAKRVLGLLFKRPMQKVWESHELYLYPYLSKTKLLPLVVQGIGQIHKTNIGNAVKTFGAFISGSMAFPERGEGDKAGGWLSALNGRLTETAAQKHPQLLQQVLQAGREVDMLLSFKNFEHMITHCMEQDGTRVTMSKRLIGSVLSAVLNSQSRVALQRPPSNDALIKALKDVQPASFTAMKGLDENDKINLKLKTRLLLPNLADTNPKQLDNPAALMASFVRCNSCNVTLLQEIAIQNYDESVVVSQYEPLDKEALVSQYSEILKMV